MFENITNTSTSGRSYYEDFKIYIGRIKDFTAEDWVIYSLWVGMMVGLCALLIGFMSAGHYFGVDFPGYVWSIPTGAVIFCLAIAIDTIGHRTVYRAELKKGESLVHGITIFCGVFSVVFLCMGKNHPELFMFPALTLIVLSFVYSLIDEALHWQRYMKGQSDRIEMWSHFGIFLGHTMFVLSWWYWFVQGYPGVNETFAFLGL